MKKKIQIIYFPERLFSSRGCLKKVDIATVMQYDLCLVHEAAIASNSIWLLSYLLKKLNFECSRNIRLVKSENKFDIVILKRIFFFSIYGGMQYGCSRPDRYINNITFIRIV